MRMPTVLPLLGINDRAFRQDGRCIGAFKSGSELIVVKINVSCLRIPTPVYPIDGCKITGRPTLRVVEGLFLKNT